MMVDLIFLSGDIQGSTFGWIELHLLAIRPVDNCVKILLQKLCILRTVHIKEQYTAISEQFNIRRRMISNIINVEDEH